VVTCRGKKKGGLTEGKRERPASAKTKRDILNTCRTQLELPLKPPLGLRTFREKARMAGRKDCGDRSTQDYFLLLHSRGPVRKGGGPGEGKQGALTITGNAIRRQRDLPKGRLLGRWETERSEKVRYVETGPRCLWRLL